MRRWPLAVLLASMPLVAGAAETGRALEIAGVTLPERAKLGTSELVLNGAGLRKRAFFKVYVAGLYLEKKTSSAAAVFALAGPKRLSITLMRNIAAPELVDALKNGIRDNSSPGEQRALENRIEVLAANLLSLGQGRRGDVITLDWLPDVGTLVVLNGEVRGDAVAGEDLYRALLKVWLGDRPTSADLKKALLGQAGR